MVILGGLEFVVGGYFVHKYYKNRKEKEEDQMREPIQRRQHSYPGAKTPRNPQQSQQQKFAYYAPQGQGYPPQPQPQPRPQSAQPPYQGRPYNAQPMPLQQQQQQSYYQPQIQPLGRQQSFASLSNMPVANGARPHNINTNVLPPLPPRPQLLSPHTIPIQPSQGQWVNQPMYNPAFNASCPNFAQPPSTPIYQTPVTAIYHVGSPQFGRNTTGIEDEWENEEDHNPHVSFDVNRRQPDEEGEDDPPPPYRP